jgi:hypothetical protein
MKMAGYSDIFEDGKILIEGCALESPDQSHLCDLTRRQAIDTRAIHIEYLSRGGSVHPADDIEEGSLPRTIRANYSSYFAFPDGEIDVI